MQKLTQETQPSNKPDKSFGGCWYIIAENPFKTRHKAVRIEEDMTSPQALELIKICYSGILYLSSFGLKTYLLAGIAIISLEISILNM